MLTFNTFPIISDDSSTEAHSEPRQTSKMEVFGKMWSITRCSTFDLFVNIKKDLRSEFIVILICKTIQFWIAKYFSISLKLREQFHDDISNKKWFVNWGVFRTYLIYLLTDLWCNFLQIMSPLYMLDKVWNLERSKNSEKRKNSRIQ